MSIALRTSYLTPTYQKTGVSVVAGDLIVICYAYNNSSNQNPSCLDNAAGGSNDYSHRIDGTVETVGSYASFGHMFYAVAKATETLTITCTNESFPILTILVYSGTLGAISTVFDSSNTSADGSSSITHVSSSITTSNAADLLICFYYSEQGAGTNAPTDNGTGFTLRQYLASAYGMMSFDKIVSATGTYYCSMNTYSTTGLGNIIAAFKSAAPTKPTQSQLMRHGDWFGNGQRQKFTF